MIEETLADLIALGEGFTTEFKRSVSSSLGREICAFANATGGVILLGVDDTGATVGVKNHNKLKSQVRDMARAAEPPIAVVVDSVGELLCVTVPEQHSKPYSFSGRFFVRDGASSQQMSRDEIREFFFVEGLVRFDETPCETFDIASELSPDRWSQFANRARVPEGLDPIKALENLHLAKEGKMSHAGAWLLADDITRFTRQAAVICAVFRGTTKTHILDRKEFHGSLYDIYEEVMEYLQAKLNSAMIPNAQGRHERLELPENALREAVVNALAHRDYRSTANAQVYVFHDRIEIVAPGGLPAGMREEDLGSKSVPRNPLLFGMLYRMGLVEQIGSGVRRIRDACLEYGAAEPVIHASENWLTVTFPRLEATVAPQVAPQVTPQVTPQVERLISALNGEMSRADLMNALGLKDRTHFSHAYLQPGLEGNFIEMTIPERPRSRMQKYRLTPKGKRMQASAL